MSGEEQTRGRCSHAVWSGVAVSALYSASFNRLSPLLGAFQQPSMGTFEQRWKWGPLGVSPWLLHVTGCCASPHVRGDLSLFQRQGGRGEVWPYPLPHLCPLRVGTLTPMPALGLPSDSCRLETGTSMYRVSGSPRSQGRGPVYPLVLHLHQAASEAHSRHLMQINSESFHHSIQGHRCPAAIRVMNDLESGGSPFRPPQSRCSLLSIPPQHPSPPSILHVIQMHLNFVVFALLYILHVWFAGRSGLGWKAETPESVVSPSVTPCMAFGTNQCSLRSEWRKGSLRTCSDSAA